MSVQTVMLGMASVVLPRHHRARWREEASAVLMEVSGARRWWYTLDTVLKVPLLAREHRRGQADGLPGRWVSAVVGGALLASLLAVTVDVLGMFLLRDPAAIGGDVYVEVPRVVPVLRMDPVGFLIVMGGLFALVVARSFRFAQRRGAALQYADSGAVLITAFVAAGPVVGWPLSIVMNLPMVAVVGNALPGVWLAAICAMALRRRTGPWPLAVVGTIAGLALAGAPSTLPLGQLMPGHQPLALLIGQLSLVVAAPTYLIWSGWAGVRLLLGRRDLLLAGPATRAGVRPDEAG
jgi:hypothetical protein